MARAHRRGCLVADGSPDEHPAIEGVRRLVSAHPAQEIAAHRLRQRAPAGLEKSSAARTMQLRPRQSTVHRPPMANRRAAARHGSNLGKFWTLWTFRLCGLLVSESRRLYSKDTDSLWLRLNK